MPPFPSKGFRFSSPHCSASAAKKFFFMSGSQHFYNFNFLLQEIINLILSSSMSKKTWDRFMAFGVIYHKAINKPVTCYPYFELFKTWTVEKLATMPSNQTLGSHEMSFPRKMLFHLSNHQLLLLFANKDKRLFPATDFLWILFFMFLQTDTF
jgi:hypothetical protein